MCYRGNKKDQLNNNESTKKSSKSGIEVKVTTLEVFPIQTKSERRKTSTHESILNSLQKYAYFFSSDDSHETMRDHTPKYISSVSVELA